MLQEKPRIYEFDEFRLDGAKRRLLRSGEVVPLFSKTFDMLMLLVESNGRDLTKDEIFEGVWPGQVLEESNLTVNISAIRKALGERAAQPRYLITIPGRGYRFVADVRERRASQDVIIESETISRITVEKEIDGDEDKVGEQWARVEQPAGAPENTLNDANALAEGPAQRLLTTQVDPSPSFLKRPIVLTALLILAALTITAAAFTVRRIRRSSAAASRFQQMKLRRLTHDGGVVNAAISPDGKFFAFIRTEKGRQSLRLGQTNGESPIELQPAGDSFFRGLEFAADGKNLYYAVSSDRQQYALYRTAILGGVPVKLRDNIAPYFSLDADNKRVAFIRSDPSSNSRSVLISNLDGSNEQTALVLPPGRNLNPACVSWSPDGSAIALCLSPEDNRAAVGIFILEVANGQLRPLGNSLWRQLARVGWLRDGTGLVTIATAAGNEEDRQVWFTAYPSGETHRMTNDLFRYDVVLSITADSNYLLTAEHQQINNVWLAPAGDLTKAKQLTFGAVNRGNGLLGLDWTPNGRIAYISATGPSQSIWVMNADGTNAKQLTTPGQFDTELSVTGDGRLIVFTSNRSGDNEIWRVNADGSDPKQLTTCGRNSEPAVSPDGKWIVYRSACDTTGGNLWRVSIDGGQPVRLTQNAAAWPWISPDGKWIACEYLVEPGKSKLAIIAFEGGSPVHLFDVPPSALFTYGIRWTLDGKAVTYRDSVSGVWRQSVDGGPPQRIEGLPDDKIYAYSWSRDGKLLAFTRGVELRDAVLISDTR